MKVIDQKITEQYSIYHGDTVEVAQGLPDNSVGFSVFSPPFESLFTYSNSDRDMGNSASSEEFWQQYRFLIKEQFRVMQQGRLVAIHCMNLPTSKFHHGFIGVRDFRGEIIRSYQEAGFIYHSEVCIWKDPVVAMQRSKALGLLHKTIKTDSSMSRQGLPDYIVVMRKPGKNEIPISGEFTHYTGERKLEGFREVEYNDGRIVQVPIKGSGTSIDCWQHYASPVWSDIRQTNTLNYKLGRDGSDERHICIAEGSLVLTKRGYIPIEEVDVFDYVMTHKGRWRKVLSKVNNGVKDVVQVKAQGVPSLLCTPDHKVYAKMPTGKREKESARKSEPSWVDATESVSGYLHLPMPESQDTDLTDKELWIIGRYLGDGHQGVIRESHGKYPSFVISCSYEEKEDLKDMLGSYCGHVSDKNTAVQIAVKGLRDRVKQLLIECRKGAKSKVLPYELISLNKEKSNILLNGYLSADGHYSAKVDKNVASSVSRGLLLGMAIVAQRAEESVVSVYAGRPERKTTIGDREVNCAQDWIFSYTINDEGKKSGWIDDKGSWKKVRAVEEKGKSVVWDIKVEEDESFVCEGAVVHNCPLQLDVIERCLQLWSKEGDIVWSPFMGIGSEGYVSLKMGRKFIGAELKESYFNCAADNMEDALKVGQYSLF